MTKERKNPWLEKSIENILPLSISDEFKIAFSEWLFSGEVIDYGEAYEQCELCEHDELRYHYKIDNKQTSKSLWVGSSCILRFEEIVIFDENENQVTALGDRKKVLEKALKDKQIDVSLEPLRKLWSIHFKRRDFIHRQAEGIKSKHGVDPECLSILFKELAKFDIQFKPEQYSVNLRSSFNRYQLVNMDSESQKLIWKAMSPQQREKYKDQMKFKNITRCSN